MIFEYTLQFKIFHLIVIQDDSIFSLLCSSFQALQEKLSKLILRLDPVFAVEKLIQKATNIED